MINTMTKYFILMKWSFKLDVSIVTDLEKIKHVNFSDCVVLLIPLQETPRSTLLNFAQLSFLAKWINSQWK